ncbi:hypothetical protein ES705_32734 [subsurface metagenome]
MDTRVKGIPVVVYNSLGIERLDVVEAEIDNNGYHSITVYDSDGNRVESQITGQKNNKVQFIFIAKVPSIGLSVFDVRPGKKKPKEAAGGELKVDYNFLENKYYRVKIDTNGDIAEIYDKFRPPDLSQASLSQFLKPA